MREVSALDQHSSHHSSVSRANGCLVCLCGCHAAAVVAAKQARTRGASSGSSRSTNTRIISPSQMGGRVFVGRFRSKLGPYQVGGRGNVCGTYLTGGWVGGAMGGREAHLFLSKSRGVTYSFAKGGGLAEEMHGCWSGGAW